MPGLKRKDADSKAGASSNGKARAANDAASKRPRKQADAPASLGSALMSGEVDFPRGGGSNLTPFEHKQALREVKAETLQMRKERQEATSRPGASGANDNLFDESAGPAEKNAQGLEKKKLNREKKNAQKKKREVAAPSSTNLPKGKGKASAAAEQSEEQPARIEVLNYKRVSVGTRLLCSVLAVHPLAAVLSLPNQLLGHVPITNISETLTRRLESAAGGSDSDSEGEEESDQDSESDEEHGESSRASVKGSKDQVPELREILEVGQWVCASVVATHSPETGRHDRGSEGAEYEQESRRIELSLDPTVVNEGVAVTDLSAGFVLPLSVKSKEDHGYVLDAGINGVGAFVTFKEAKEAGKNLHVGQVILAGIESTAASKRTINVSLRPLNFAKAVADVVPSSSALLPGNFVNALVTNVSDEGLNVKLFGMFDGTVDAVHLPQQESYKIGQRLKVRVLWEVPPQMQDDVEERKFALSAAQHITSLSRRGAELQQAYPIGATVKAQVASTIEDWGLTCTVKEASRLKAFVHISNVSDDHIARLPANTGAFRVGSVHEARVIGHALTDDVLRLSFEESVLKRSFMRVSEVVPGEIIKCTIKAVKPQAIVLDMNGSVDGVVFPTHFADVPLKKPEKKYQVGQKVNARVLSVDPERNRIALTLKRTLVQSELAVVGSVQDARVGVVTHAVVARVLDGNVGPSAILVDLYNNLRAYVPISEALEASGGGNSSLSSEVIKASFFVGKAVKVRLTRVEYDTGRISASIRQASDSFLQRLNVDAVQVGEEVQGKLAAIHQDVVVLELQPSKVRALLGLNTLARERKTTVDDLRETLTEGETVSKLKVLDKKGDRGIVIVGGLTSKPKSEGTQSYGQVREADLKTGALVTARASRKEGNSLTLHVGNLLRCTLHATDCADDYGDQSVSSLLPAEGSHVKVALLNVRGSNANRRAEVSTRPSRLDAGTSAKTIRDSEVNKIDDIRVGQKYRGFVRAVADKNGLFVELGRNIIARVMIAELFDEYVKDWTAHFTLGQLVEGTITSVDAASKKVEMSLRSKRERMANGKRAQQDDSSSAVSPSKFSIRDIKEGQKHKAFVKGVAEYGVFVQIEGTRLSGLAHKSQLSDDSSAVDALKAFKVGDKVKAFVLKVDAEKNRLSFGLKPSLFDDQDFEDSDQESEAADDTDSDQEQDARNLLEEESEASGEDDSDAQDSDVEMDADALLDGGASDSDEEFLKIDHGSGSEAEDDESEEDAEDVEDDDESSSGDILTRTGEDDDFSSASEQSSDEAEIPALNLKGGLSWNAADNHDNEQSDSESSESSDDEDNATGSRSKRRKSKKIMQEDLTADLATKMPETSTDFERLLLGSPNSSFLWIQFISFYVQLGDINKARDTAQRALQTMHYREEQEKFNVWIALLNLENTYGDDASLETTFKEACAYNDAQAIHVRLADILEQSGKTAAAEEQWKRTAKKFGVLPEVWVNYHRFLLRHQPDGDEARSMVARSMQSLEKRSHVETIVAYALNEFKLGDAERGRTIFEGLVDSYPKRLDIWLQYIDQESRLDHAVQVRELFERTLLLKQSSKKVKSILKKWLDFEKRKGTAATQQAVLDRARRFVEERAEASGQDDAGVDAEEGDNEAQMSANEDEDASDDDVDEDASDGVVDEDEDMQSGIEDANEEDDSEEESEEEQEDD